MAKIINVRDSLIAAGAVRIPTRSKEWTTMTLAEVENSKEIESNGEKLFLIEVNNRDNKCCHTSLIIFYIIFFQIYFFNISHVYNT